MDPTCSTLTGRYLDRSACVLLMMDLLTISAISSIAFFPAATAASVASPSLPLKIGFSNFFRNSVAVPRRPSFTKWTREKYSSKSFWIGVPERRTLEK